MDLEHVEAVRARIEDIRRRFVDAPGVEPSTPAKSAGPQSVSFAEALTRAKSGKQIACPAELEPIIASAAQKYGVKPSVIKAVIQAESGFRSNAVSRVGAQGLMQLMPGTAKALGVDPTDPGQNIDGGTKYIKQLMDRFGSLDQALAAYNAGPASVIRYGGIPPYEETRRYVSKIMESVAMHDGDE